YRGERSGDPRWHRRPAAGVSGRDRAAPSGARRGARAMTDTTWVEVSSAALRHNLAAIQARVAPAAVMAVVQGNAYGHGQREVADALRDVAEWFGVNALHEAQALRDHGHRAPVLILGAMHPEQAHAVVCGDFRQVIYDVVSLDALGAAAERNGRTARVHLKV